MKTFKKVLLGLLVLVVVYIGMFYMSMNGNPIRKHQINKEVNIRLESEFPKRGLIAEKAYFNFKNDTYEVDIIDPKTKLQYFTYVYDAKGNREQSMYALSVPGEDTLEYANFEYQALFSDSLEIANDSEQSLAFLDFNTDKNAKANLRPKIDLKELGSKYGHVYLSVKVNEVSKDKLKNIIVEFMNQAKAIDFKYHELSVYLFNDQDEIYLGPITDDELKTNLNKVIDRSRLK